MRSSILVVGVLAAVACSSEPMQEEENGAATEAALIDVASALNGQMLLAPCGVDTFFSVCSSIPPGTSCPPANINDRALTGAIRTDKTVTLGGVRGRSYTIRLHVQGEVESKTYTGTMDHDGSHASPAADGFAKGGVPSTADAYNVTLLRVTNPGATTHTDYFLNSLNPPGVSNHTTYGVDYTATIQAEGGATIRLVYSDSNCSMIKNCGPTPNDGSICKSPLVISNIEPAARSHNPSFNFDTPYNGQWLVMVVKSVSTP